jgi:RNA polymerase sigma-70 factor (ECF subfamily)
MMADADKKAAIAGELAYVRSRTAGLAARSRLGHEADDIASVVLLIALSSVDRFDGANVRGWLLAIIRGEISNRRRSSQVRRTISTEATGPDGSAGLVDRGMEGAQEASLMLREVQAALPLLPREQLEVIQVVTLGGGSLYEAAHVLGLPIGTVKSRLSRGPFSLRQMLEHGLPPDKPVSSSDRRGRGRPRARRSADTPEGAIGPAGARSMAA